MEGKKRKLNVVLVRWFLLIGVLGSFLSLTTYFYFIYDSMKNYTFHHLNSIRDHQVLLINIWFEERKHDIKLLSGIHALKQKDLTGIRENFSVFSGLVNDFQNLFFADSEGRILVLTPQNDVEIDVRDRSYYQAALEGKEYISEILVSRLDGTRLIIVSCPVYSPDGRIIGVVGGSLTLDRIDQIVQTFKEGKTGETYLVDKTGTMISESRFTNFLIQKGFAESSTKYNLNANSESVKRAIQGQSGYLEYKNYRGVQVWGAYQWVPEHEWGVVVEIEKEEIVGNWWDRIIVVIGVLIFLTILLLYPLSKMLAGKIAPPLTELTEKVSHFARDYKSSSLSWTMMNRPPYEELKILQDSFFQMGEEMAQLMNILEIQALHDPLTGLANRRYFLERGWEVIEISRRRNSSCSVVFLDIDRFKSINDTYGHTAGDEVLAAIARMVRENVRINDYAGRLGGEEFAIVSPDTEEEGAYRLAERLRQYVEITPIPAAGHQIFVTISLGVVTYHDNTDQRDAKEVLEELLKQADTAMYQAKKLGRNRVEIFRHHNKDRN